MLTFITFKKVVIKKDKYGIKTYHPLFVQRNRQFKIGERFDAETVDIEQLHGLAFRQIVAEDIDGNKIPKGALHCCFEPNAPHIKDSLTNGEQRCWLMGKTIVGELKEDFQVIRRPLSQGGNWMLCTNFTPICEVELCDLNKDNGDNGSYFLGFPFDWNQGMITCWHPYDGQHSEMDREYHAKTLCWDNYNDSKFWELARIYKSEYGALPYPIKQVGNKAYARNLEKILKKENII